MCHNNEIAESGRLSDQTDERGRETLRLTTWRHKKSPLANQGGFGLVAAIFAMVILALFGVLAARYIFTTSISSAEDYLWTQSLYAAEAAAQRRILYNDGGGTGAFVAPTIQNIITAITTDTFTAAGSPAVLAVRGTVPGSDITRVIEIKYIL